jgi:hypothetical protein
MWSADCICCTPSVTVPQASAQYVLVIESEIFWLHRTFFWQSPKKVRSFLRSYKNKNFKFDRTFFWQSQKKVRSFWELTTIFFFIRSYLFLTITNYVRSFWDLTKIKILNSIVLFFDNHKIKYDHFWDLTKIKFLILDHTFFRFEMVFVETVINLKICSI